MLFPKHRAIDLVHSENYRLGGNSCSLGSFFCMSPRRGQHLPKVSFTSGTALSSPLKGSSRLCGNQRIVLSPCHSDLMGWKGGMGERWGGGRKKVAFTLGTTFFQNVLGPQWPDGPIKKHQKAQVLWV